MARYPDLPTWEEAVEWDTIYRGQHGQCRTCREEFAMKDMVRPEDKFALYCQTCILDVKFDEPLLVIPGEEYKVEARAKEKEESRQLAEKANMEKQAAALEQFRLMGESRGNDITPGRGAMGLKTGRDGWVPRTKKTEDISDE